MMYTGAGLKITFQGFVRPIFEDIVGNFLVPGGEAHAGWSLKMMGHLTCDCQVQIIR
jgi:hypothetical protein